jgi:hypothetical protein
MMGDMSLKRLLWCVTEKAILTCHWKRLRWWVTGHWKDYSDVSLKRLLWCVTKKAMITGDGSLKSLLWRITEKTMITRDGCQCFLHRQKIGCPISCDSSSEMVSWTTSIQEIYPNSDPSLDVTTLHPARWYWRKTNVTWGEQSARMVHVLKGFWISCLLPKG